MGTTLYHDHLMLCRLGEAEALWATDVKTHERESYAALLMGDRRSRVLISPSTLQPPTLGRESYYCALSYMVAMRFRVWGSIGVIWG